ncbi:hypothetical protein ARMGADRAFT_1071014 [Armillaria gallica]|uniref:Uncharacterized protein n=1 Tax=Armillaria gallica TaxID=47427 RepID=A0A2H3EF11_ARMGA|nr:hypothetical protein ARMGADRAFT_1071014 [Armillaria gallica]
MSSRMKVEDLVTNEDDQQHEQEHHIWIEQAKEDKPPQVRFWDRPRSEHRLIWPGDSRVPHEWNRVISNMWELDANHKAPLFNYPDFPLTKGQNVDINDRLSFVVPTSKVESEGPYEFTETMFPNEWQREYILYTMSMDGKPTDEAGVRIAQMVINNEWRNHHDDTTTMGDQTNWAKRIDKGKAKETGACQPEDIPSLRQHWYDEYEELLQGVPDAMPPYQMVNHKIPLIDPDKRYHYHLPRCPNVL